MLEGDGEAGPHISVAAGVVVGLLASFVQSFGLTVQRLSHVANEKLPVSERKRDWQRPLWLGGFAIFILSNVFGTVFQIGALPIVVLGPLGAVSLLWNAAFARIVLGDEFTVHLVVGTVLIAGGAVLIGIFGVVPEQTHTLPELVRLYRRPAFIVWVSLLALFLLLILSAAHLTEWRLSRHLASLEDSLTSPRHRRPSWMLKSGSARRWSAPSRSTSLDLASPPRPKSALKSTISTAAADLSDSETTPLLSHSKQFRLTFAETESEADSNNLYSPAPSIVGGRDPTQPRSNSTPPPGCAHERKVAATRIWIGAAYGATSGTLSGLCLLFTKTGIELLIMSIVGKSNQFGHFEPWLIVIVLLVCELFQLAYLNRALRVVGPTLVCPLAFCFYNTCSIVSGLIYYDQWDELSTVQIVLVTLGIAILLGGVWIVSIKSGGTSKSDDLSSREGKNPETEVHGDRILAGESFVTEPEAEDSASDEDETCQEDEPLEWRPRGFSIGLAASSPGFDLRPAANHPQQRSRRRFSHSLPHHSTLDPVIRDASDEPYNRHEQDLMSKRNPNPNPRSQSMRGSLSGSLYVGPSMNGTSGTGHKRNKSSGTISLPSTPTGREPSDSHGRGAQQHGVRLPHTVSHDRSRQAGEGGDPKWWRFWGTSREKGKAGRLD
ncbi:DMT family transporter [Sporobolomyces koalae]|uniref:DMT family transporter n=1 Tax=Sporobolomyces koalae TaxID=500713 RepID=UPI00316B5D7E